MSKLWHVARHEYRRHVLRKGFLAAILSIPVLIVIISLVAGGISLLRSGTAESTSMGYVDLAGILAEGGTLSTGSAEGPLQLSAYQTEENASAALASKAIDAYFVLAEDYARTGQVRLVADHEPSAEAIQQFRAVLQEGLVVSLPEEVARRAIAGSSPVLQSPDGRLEFAGRPTLVVFMPALASLLFVLLIFVSSGYLTQAVVEEKASRTMEILVTSVSPRQLVGGKLLGIVAVTATLLAAWAAVAVTGIVLGGQVFEVEWLQELRFDARTAALLAALLVPAFLFVAALMTAMGTAFAGVRGNQQVVAVFLSVYLLPFGLILPVLSTPTSSFAVALSLFPLTAPIMLPLRYGLTQVPGWQIAASITIQSVLALGALWLAVRALRLGTLRSGKGVHWRELLGMGRGTRGAARAVGHRSPVGVPNQLPAATPVKDARHRVRKAILVFRYELLSAIRRPPYLLIMIGLPVFVFVNVLIMEAAMPGGSTATTRPGTGEAAADGRLLPGQEVQGYVDASGLLRTVPANLPPGALLAYADEISGREALARGDISALHLIPDDYVATGALTTIRPDLNPLAGDNPSGWIDWALLVNLLDGDAELAGLVWQPMNLERVSSAPAEQATEPEDENIFTFFLTEYLPAVIMLLLYGMIALGSGMLMASVSDEKKNRAMEIMLLAVNARQMLAGKIAALGLAGLLQAAGWVCVSYLLFRLAGPGGDLPTGFDLPPSLLLWAVFYFVLGYAVYATLMAGAGALIPNVKESPMVSLIFFAPAFVGFEISLFSTGNPHGLLPTVASLFPLTAPFSMINRLVVGGVPSWQLLLSVGLMLLSIPLIVRAVARMFRTQVLLASQPFTIKRYFHVFLGRGA